MIDYQATYYEECRVTSEWDLDDKWIDASHTPPENTELFLANEELNATAFGVYHDGKFFEMYLSGGTFELKGVSHWRVSPFGEE